MPSKSTVKLVSMEGFEFVIDYKAACVSNTIRNMLSSQGAGEVARPVDVMQLENYFSHALHAVGCVQASSRKQS